MQAMANILEATRFISDRAYDQRNQAGRPLLSIGVQAASLLVRVCKEGDQQLIIAAMLHPFDENSIPLSEIRQVFGVTVWDYVKHSRDDESLKIPAFQRLATASLRKPVEAGRKIRVACVASLLSQPQTPEQNQEHLQSISAFSHTVPELHALIQTFL